MGGAASVSEHEFVLDVLSIAEPAFAVNGERQIVAWNDAAERLLGIAADDVIGVRCSEALEARSGALCANCEVCPEVAARGLGQETYVTPLGQPALQARMTALTAHTAGGQTRIVHLLRAAPVPPPHLAHEALPPQSLPIASGSRLPRPVLLTAREYEVLRLLGAGHSTDQIAGELSITRVTARNHVNKVLDKLGASSRLQAVVIASQLRLI